MRRDRQRPGPSRPRLLAAAAALTLLAAGAASADPAGDAQRRPAVFFYPPPALFPGGGTLSSPLTVAVDQATVMVPRIDEMAGIAVLLPWSVLCPDAARCDFAMLDRILRYWRRRGRRVVLGVAAVGNSFRVVSGGATVQRRVTPDWVMARSAGYESDVRELGSETMIRARFPRYDDPVFRDAVRSLVRQLSRYDGDPAIAQLRIGLGMLGEDDPNPNGGYRSAAPGFTDADWLAFCRSQLALFRSAFRRTTLEVDLGAIGHVAASGAPADRRDARALLAELVRDRIFLAFNGWSGDTAVWERTAPESGIAPILDALAAARAHGNGAGLEALAPITDPAMQDMDAMLRLGDRVRPDRVIFFSELSGFLAHRDGRDRAPDTALDFWTAQPRRDAAVPAALRLRAWLRTGFGPG